MEYYNIDRIKAHNPDYAFIVGGRSNGKSHAVARMLLEDFLDNGQQFLRVVRYIFDMQEKYISSYFDKNNLEWLDEQGYSVYYESGCYYIYENENPRKTKRILGYVVSLSSEQKIKSNQYDNVTKIILEEFALLDPSGYLSNEIDKFLSLLSTVVRMRKNVSVWLIGNTISKYNPYFKLLHINIDKLNLKPGDLRVIEQPDLGYDAKPKVVIEFAKMAYEVSSEIPNILKVGDNDTATVGLYIKPKDVIEPEEVNTSFSKMRYIVKIGEYIFIWYILPCFTYWQRWDGKAVPVHLILKNMCYDENKYFWFALKMLRENGVIIPDEWYYDSEETKNYIYENVIKERKLNT